jgi:hypothetical protein
MPVDQRGGGDLDREGYAMVRGFVSGGGLERLQAAVEAKVLSGVTCGCERPDNMLVPLRWNDDVVQRALGCERRLAAVRGITGAEDMRWISGYVSVKEGRSPPLGWHQDWWCWEHPVTYRTRPPQVALLCYLADTSPQAAALRVLPRTHRRSVDLHGLLPEAHGKVAGMLDERHPTLRDHPEQRTLSVRAGDAVVIDYRLLHGTHANKHLTGATA